MFWCTDKTTAQVLVFFQLNFCICSSQNHVLEMALHSSGLQNQSKKLYRGEMSRLMEKDQQLLRQENERLQAEVCSIKGDLVQSREKVSWGLQQTVMNFKNQQSLVFHFPSLSRSYKPFILCLQVRQLDATIMSLKQHKQQSQSSLVKALEQENTSLKQELEAQKELNKV